LQTQLGFFGVQCSPLRCRPVAVDGLLGRQSCLVSPALLGLFLCLRLSFLQLFTLAPLLLLNLLFLLLGGHSGL
jgi:hypothetical protein